MRRWLWGELVTGPGWQLEATAAAVLAAVVLSAASAVSLEKFPGFAVAAQADVVHVASNPLPILNRANSANLRPRTAMTNRDLTFTLWDVEHGVSIWIHTPNGSNHWIDLGRTPDFSPSEHVGRMYRVADIDYLVISHPDADHLEDLPQFKATFGDPRALSRNKSLPAADMFGQRTFQYQKEYADLHNRFTAAIPREESPTNPDYNGGVRYAIHSLDHGTRVNGSTFLGSTAVDGNNTSLVVMLLYEGVLFVCPGDIEPLGWRELWRLHATSYGTLIDGARYRFLVAPHHGRKSGYCKEMMDAIQPHATFISDVWGASETHSAFRRDPLGVRFRSGDTVKYYTTKRAGRIQVAVSAANISIDQYDQ